MMLYLDRSEVRSILIGQPDECLHITESVLAEIDALPIFTKDDVAAALSAAPVETWKCAARKQSLPEPADCGWPTCGCDPHADKVIAALEEQGHAAPVAQEPVATAPVSPDVWTRRVVREAMQDAWNDICHDTGCHPIDIRNVNGVVFFEPRHWAEQVASLLFARTVRDTLASTPPATPARVSAEETEVFVVTQSDLPVSLWLTRSAADKICASYARQKPKGKWAVKAAILALLSRAGDQK